jgi:PAS domain S-box-containing protein
MSFYGMGNEPRMIEDALEAADMAWWLMELPSGAVFFSPNKVKLLGYSAKDASKFVHYTSFTELIHPDDYDSAMKAMEDHLSGEAPIYETTYRIRTKKGGYITLYDRGRIVAEKGKDLAIAGIVIDVTRYHPGKLLPQE